MATPGLQLQVADPNEEAIRPFLPQSASHPQVLAVADGMGGQAGGEQASRLAMERVTSCLPGLISERHKPDDDSRWLKDVMRGCQEDVREFTQSHPRARGMGTTLTLAVIRWPSLLVAHAGDSRAYLLRRGAIRQLTTDHTVAQQLLASGADQESLSARWDHVLWNVVGGDGRSLQPEVIRWTLEQDDVLLLCTDGLTRGLSDAEIARIMLQPVALEESIAKVMERSRDADGRDNLTVVAARFKSDQAGSWIRQERRRMRRTDTWPCLPPLNG